MKAVIHKIVSINHQDCFGKSNVWENLIPIQAGSAVVAPDYKEYIPAASLRRFSPVLRMSLTAAQSLKTDEAFDSISVGTSLGCLKDTEKFLQTFIQATGDTLSPTAFIQSTHNTIAGAISMVLGNHAYNMTHTQNSLSFETALIDGVICLNDGKKNVLVGAADEAIDFLEQLKEEMIQTALPLTSGTTFLVLKPEGEGRKIIDCQIRFSCTDLDSEIAHFLEKNNVDPDRLALVLQSNNLSLTLGKQQINYEQFTGLYYTSSAFALHLANDFQKHSDDFVLIVNNQMNGKLGLTLIG